MARLAALIIILDPLRAHLPARIRPTALLHVSRSQDMRGAKMQEDKYDQPCHNLGMPELRNVLYGLLTKDLLPEATESRHQEFQEQPNKSIPLVPP